MKKSLFSWVLIIVLLVSCQIAHADDAFSIRNGIQFGMSPKEIQNLEQKEQSNIAQIGNIVGPAVSYAYFYVALNDLANNWNSNNIYDLSSSLIFKDKVAGQECGVIYHFDNNALASLQYLCEYTSNMQNITEALQGKYGEPHYSSKVPFVTNNSSSVYVSACQMQYPGSKFSQVSYAGWLLPYDDFCIVIEAECFTGDSTFFWECVTYTAISMDEYNKVVNETQNSINNDL